MSPRIQTSEPAYHAPVSQWQRERARGRLQPMEQSDVQELTWLALIWLVVAPVLVAAYWFWRAM